MKENFASQEIFNHFLKFKNYVNPPDEEAIGWVLVYAMRYDYPAILKKYGIRYLLVILDMYEKNDDFEICKRIIDFIEENNRKFLTKYPLHITKLNRI